MKKESDLIPVLQLEDLEALKAAQEHLATRGYKTRVCPFIELPSEEHQDWMTPANGGYLFYLEQSKYDKAMEMPGSFFGYTPEEDEAE